MTEESGDAAHAKETTESDRGEALADELKRFIVDQTAANWAATRRPLLLTELSSLLDSAGYNYKSIIPPWPTLKRYAADNLSDFIQIVTHPVHQARVGFIPKGEHYAFDTGEVRATSLGASRPDRYRIQEDIWRAFTTPIPSGELRYFLPGDMTVVNLSPSDPPPSQAIPITSDIIDGDYDKTPARSFRVYKNFEGWLRANNLSKSVITTPIIPRSPRHQDNKLLVLAELLSDLGAEEFNSFSIPARILVKLYLAK